MSSHPSHRGASGALQPPLALRPAAHAFFLDLDGTLLEFAALPEAVQADAALSATLQRLFARTGGAIALVSGRTIAEVDRLTRPHRFPASGIHGLERRSAALGYVRAAAKDPGALAAAAGVLRGLSQRHPQLLLEDKVISLALHYREAPQLRDFLASAVEAIPGVASGALRLQHGHQVIEVMPAGVTKATALAAFMAERPFSGRRPLFIGDDLTDECAFEWVNAHGGLAIAVAPQRPTAATAALESVSAVRAWLQALVEPT